MGVGVHVCACTYVWVCMCVCMCVCMYMCVHVCVHVCMGVSTHVCHVKYEN